MTDPRTIELRERILKDYDLQVAAINSILNSFTANEGKLAKPFAVVADESDLREFYGAEGVLEFSIDANFMDSRDTQPYLENGVIVTYVPDTGFSYVHHSHYDAGSETNSEPHSPDLLSREHSFNGWDDELRAKLVDNLSWLKAPQMEHLVVTVKASEDFMQRKLATFVAGRLWEAKLPEDALQQRHFERTSSF
jgi:hypothetical protein